MEKVNINIGLETLFPELWLVKDFAMTLALTIKRGYPEIFGTQIKEGNR